ncbi:uncharacterized protein C8Q71DRAFT_728923 [Rhodofomes roseus]|uniref:Uncharacterized protein n=1 Tax=Rhodofomes roseus TaxID=34475 RepID=A0ABQ8KW94_9APHY|nr:uncharacterized protein C8Q71DRAFT_728923 [Rhodofomes roseus]KAH9843552.1 hypothetical protein C8Q71DRAFT_728923 [Rhodofomes roseus]
MHFASESVLSMSAPGPIVQISPTVAQEVIALQAAELIRLRIELGYDRSGSSQGDGRGVVSLEQFNELRRDLLEAAFAPKENNDSLRTELVSISERMRAMQCSLEEFLSRTTRVAPSDNGTQVGSYQTTAALNLCMSEKQVDGLTHQLAVAREELRDAHSAISRLEDERAKNEARVSDLVKQLLTAHVQSRDLQELLQRSQEVYSIAQVRRAVHGLVMTIMSMQTKVSGMEDQTAFLRDENQQLRQRTETLTAESNQRQLHLDELNECFASTIAHHEEEVASLCMAVEVVKDGPSRPSLLGTVRSKVAQVYKGVGGYLPQQSATNIFEPPTDENPSRATVLVEEPQSDVNAEPSSAVHSRGKARGEEDTVLGDSDSSTAGSVVSLTDFASESSPRPGSGEPEHSRVIRRDSSPDPCECALARVSETQGNPSSFRLPSETLVSSAGLSHARTGRKIEDVLTPLPMKVITQAALDHLQRTCGNTNHRLFVNTCTFVVGEFIESPYFVKPSMVINTLDGKWVPCKHKAFHKRVAKGSVDLVAAVSRSLYYLGTYTIMDTPEPWTANDFGRLPEVTQRCESGSGCPAKRTVDEGCCWLLVLEVMYAKQYIKRFTVPSHCESTSVLEAARYYYALTKFKLHPTTSLPWS